MDIVKAAAKHLNSVAVHCPASGQISYEQLLRAAEHLASQLSRSVPATKGADGPRIGVYAEPGPGYVAATWASWLAGCIVVPLAVTHPPHELQYVIEDAGISTVLAHPDSHSKLHAACQATGARLQELIINKLAPQPENSLSSSNSSTNGIAGRQSSSSGALIVYTSGTTGRPKGALHTHGSLAAQVACLTQAWQWSHNDTIVHALPLHHVHGIINALYCAHAVGATVNFLPKFSPSAVWQQLMAGDVSVLMAVPTMYSYLLSHYQQHMSAQEQAGAKAAAARLRLAVSGSAAAPVPLLERWKELSGQMLLERYGMTETGMILSNPYQGERRPGFVGLPLPGVEVKLVWPASDTSASADADPDKNSSGSGNAHQGSAAPQQPSSTPAPHSSAPGELAVKGPMLFREYWGRPEATAAAFDDGGFFLTGDTVCLEGDPPYYKIMGRTSVDIIKSGGYKLSALDIESTLMHHPQVSEAAVLGVPDEHLGQMVVALVHFKPAAAAAADNDKAGSTAQLLDELRQLCLQELPPYSVPRKWHVLEASLPRNAMGKVNKKELLAAYQADAV